MILLAPPSFSKASVGFKISVKLMQMHSSPLTYLCCQYRYSRYIYCIPCIMWDEYLLLISRIYGKRETYIVIQGPNFSHKNFHFSTHTSQDLFTNLFFYLGDSVFCIVISSFVEPLVTARLCVCCHILSLTVWKDSKITGLLVCLNWAQNANSDHPM